MSDSTRHTLTGAAPSIVVAVTESTRLTGRFLSASVFLKTRRAGGPWSISLAYLGEQTAEACRVDISRDYSGLYATLWIGPAAADIPPADAERIAGLLNVRLRREEDGGAA